MGVTLTTPPPSVFLSADLVNAKFTCTDYFQQLGVKSVNKLTFLTPPFPGSGLTISFGNASIVFSAALTPDNSGKQITGFADGIPVDLNLAVSIIASDFRRNALLSEKYIITSVENEVFFTARKAGKGVDFNGDGVNVTAGVDEIVRPNYAVAFKLFIENALNDGFDQIYEAQLQLISGGDGLAQVQISDKLHASIEADLRTLYPDQPSDFAEPAKKSCRRYYFEYAEAYGETIEIKSVHRSDEFTVLHGGLSTIAQFNQTILGLITPSTADNDRFLKQGANAVYTRTNQPQYLYFYNARTARTSAKLICAVEYADGATSTIELATTNMASLRKYAFNVTFDKIKPLLLDKKVKKYQVYLALGSDRISEIRTFFVDYSARSYIRYFLNWSSFGGLDTRVCYGQGETEFELFNKTAERVRQAGDDIKAGSKFSFSSKLTRSHSISTGWLSKRELQLNADFFLSNFKYRYTGGLMLPISIAPGKIPELSDGNHLFAQKFEYSYLFDDHAYTEGDAEDSGEVISDFFFSTPSVIVSPGGFTETDPTVPSWVKSITVADINKWNSAANPSDLNNFYNKTEIAAILGGATSISGYNKANWDIAFAWGNHAGHYQPVEDQRLSSTDLVSFATVSAGAFYGGSFQGEDFYSFGGIRAEGEVRTLTGLTIEHISGFTTSIVSASISGNIVVSAPSANGQLALVSQIPTNVVRNDGANYNINITGTADNSNYLATIPAALYHKSIGFGAGSGTNANTVAENTSSFSYANNAPHNGSLVHFGNGGYGLQFNASYFDYGLAFRSRNGDASTWNNWRQIIYNDADKTWDFNITGSALLWNGTPFTAGNIPTTPYFITLNSTATNAGYSSLGQVSAALGVNNGSTLNNNISGSANAWAGNYNTNTAKTPSYFLVNEGSTSWGYASLANVKSSLAISLHDVMSVSGATSNFMKITGADNVKNGKGLELFSNSDGVGIIQSFDRGGSNTLLPLFFSGSNFIFSTGNVGIGTTSPSENLHVVGNGLFTGSLVAAKVEATSELIIPVGAPTSPISGKTYIYSA